MGAIQKAIESFTGADEKAAQSKERLELLRNAAQAHLTIAQGKIGEMLRGQGGGIRVRAKINLPS